MCECVLMVARKGGVTLLLLLISIAGNFDISEECCVTDFFFGYDLPCSSCFSNAI